MKNVILFLYFLQCFNVFAQNDKKVELIITPGEYWWAGISSLGHQTPYDETTISSNDMWGDNLGNQTQPLLLPSKGRYVWSEEPKMVISLREVKRSKSRCLWKDCPTSGK